MIENDSTLNIGGEDIMMLINNLAHNIKGIRTDIRMLEIAINELRKTK